MRMRLASHFHLACDVTAHLRCVAAHDDGYLRVIVRQHLRRRQHCFRVLKCVLVYRTPLPLSVKASQLMQRCQGAADVAQEIVVVMD